MYKTPVGGSWDL